MMNKLTNLRWEVAMSNGKYRRALVPLRKLLSCALIGVALTPALANAGVESVAKWDKKIWESSDQAAYVDTKSASLVGKTTVRIWTKSEFFNYRLSPLTQFKHQSVAMYNEVDCANQRLRVLQLIAYEKSNLKGLSKVMDVPAGGGPWQYPVPSSFAQTLLKFSCS